MQPFLVTLHPPFFTKKEGLFVPDCMCVYDVVSRFACPLCCWWLVASERLLVGGKKLLKACQFLVCLKCVWDQFYRYSCKTLFKNCLSHLSQFTSAWQEHKIFGKFGLNNETAHHVIGVVFQDPGFQTELRISAYQRIKSRCSWRWRFFFRRWSWARQEGSFICCLERSGRQKGISNV